MPRTRIKVLTTDQALRWPKECAHCCASGTALRPVQAGIARGRMDALDAVRGRVRFSTLALHYPVCQAHAQQATLASWLMRKSPLPTLLRAWFWFTGPQVLLFVLLALAGLGLALIKGSTSNGHGSSSNLPWPLLALCLVSALGWLAVLWARVRVPVRLVRLEDDAVTLDLSNPRFARHFVRANEDLIVSA
jgi:hypothetical protein